MNEKLVSQLRHIVSRFPEIKEVLLFGSRAHGDFKQFSDIDLAVKAPKLSDMDWLTFSEQVENELDTLLKIDLTRWENASVELKNQIQECYQEII